MAGLHIRLPGMLSPPVPPGAPADHAEFRRVAGRPGAELYRARLVQHAFEPHAHQAYGLGVIEAGVERFRYRGTDHLAAPQSIVAMHPDVLHTGRAETAGGWRYRMLYLDPALIDALTGEAHWWFGEVVEARHPALARHLVSLHRQMWHSDDSLQVDGLLLDFLAGLRPLARTGPGGPRDGAAARLGPVIDCMRALLHERLALADLAAVAELSPFHFQRKFKAQYHVTPHQMLMALRLARAKELLAQGVRAAEVAVATGLTDQAHLTRAFAIRYGVSPGRYQRQVR